MTMKNVVSLHKPEAPFAAVAREAFADALDRVGRVVERKNTVPILSAVRLECRKGALIITGTDLDIEIKVTVPVTADSTEMTAIINLQELRGFLRLAAGDFIRITSSESGDRAIIYCGGSELDAPVFNLSDWPDNPVPFEKKGFSAFDISPGTFRCGLDSALPATSTDATRFYLNGAYLHRLDGDVVRIVATDGHRLHMRDMHLSGRSKFSGSGILPNRLLAVLKATIEAKSYGGLLKVAMSGNEPRSIRFTLGDMIITSKMVDGTYPDYQRTLPREATSTVKMSARAVLRFLSGLGDAKSVKLSIFPDTCLIESRFEDVSRRVEIDAELTGEPVTVGINRTYLRQAIEEACPAGGDIVLGIFAPDSPLTFRGTEKHFRAVLMPMRV